MRWRKLLAHVCIHTYIHKPGYVLEKEGWYGTLSYFWIPLCLQMVSLLANEMAFRSFGEKHLKYGEEIDHTSLLPFVLSCTGSAVPFTSVTMKRLGAKLSEKFNSAYTSLMGFLC